MAWKPVLILFFAFLYPFFFLALVVLVGYDLSVGLPPLACWLLTAGILTGLVASFCAGLEIFFGERRQEEAPSSDPIAPV